MREFVQISENIINMIKDASDFDTRMVSIALYNNKFMVAVEDIRSMFCMVNVPDTDHPNFMVGVDKKLVKEIIKPGLLKVSVSDDKTTITFSTYSYNNKETPWTRATIGYSYTVAILSMAERMVDGILTPITVNKELFSNNILDMMEHTGASLSVSENTVYSIGKGLSLFLTLDGETDSRVSFDKASYKMILKKLRPHSEFYISGNTFIMQTGLFFYTWRSEYVEYDDIKPILSKKPKAEYHVQLEYNAPFLNMKQPSKGDRIPAEINLLESSIKISLTSINSVSRIVVKKISGEDVTLIRVPQEYLKYLYAPKGVTIGVFSKFIRISNESSTIDLGCEVVVSKELGFITIPQ